MIHSAAPRSDSCTERVSTALEMCGWRSYAPGDRRPKSCRRTRRVKSTNPITQQKPRLKIGVSVLALSSCDSCFMPSQCTFHIFSVYSFLCVVLGFVFWFGIVCVVFYVHCSVLFVLCALCFVCVRCVVVPFLCFCLPYTITPYCSSRTDFYVAFCVHFSLYCAFSSYCVVFLGLVFFLCSFSDALYI